MSAVGQSPSPLRVAWRIFRTRLLPIAIWLGAVVLVGALWRPRAERLEPSGAAEAHQADGLIARHDGAGTAAAQDNVP